MKELGSGTLAFLRQKSTSFMSVQESKQRTVLTGKTQSHNWVHTESLCTRWERKTNEH